MFGLLISCFVSFGIGICVGIKIQQYKNLALADDNADPKDHKTSCPPHNWVWQPAKLIYQRRTCKKCGRSEDHDV